MSNPLQVIAGMAVVFFLPGWTLVNMLFPRRGELDPDYDQLYRLALGMGLSIVISIMVGFGLNAISTEEHGYVTAGPLWLVLLSVTLLFGVAGWLRGAYPWAGYIHPRCYRAPAAEGVPKQLRSDFQRDRRLHRLIAERERLLADVEAFSERMTTSNPQRKMYYSRRLEQSRARIGQINDELKELASARGDRP